MATLDTKSASGTKAGTVELDDAMFGVEPNVPVMHQVVTAQLAARRSGTQSTKTRAEVRGGGAKPWKQKGTGRARAGSSRSPIWVGGGVSHAPKPRSYAQRTPKKMIRLALKSALSDRLAAERILVIDWDLEAPSTKAALAILKANGVSGRVLAVLRPEDERRVEEPPQPGRRPHLRHRRAQRLRRARVGLAALHARHPARRQARDAAAPTPPPRPRRWRREGPPRRDHRPHREREVLRPLRGRRLHVQGAPRRRRSPRSTTRSRRSST